MNCLRWLEIDLGVIGDNVKQIKKIIGSSVGLIAVVKANAYGHGLVPVAEKALKSGAKGLAVFDLEEALKLRETKIQAPILILGFVEKKNLNEVIQHNISLALYDLDTVRELSKLGQAKVHLKIDTGMHRLGILPDNIKNFTKQLKQFKNLDIEGVFSHFADPNDKDYAKFQINNFKKVLSYLKTENINPPMVHMAKSDALDLPESYFTHTRCGIALYGFIPSAVNSNPSLSFKAKIISLKKIPTKSYIGYLKTYQTKGLTKIAVLGVGYADGYDRGLSNRGEVLIKGTRCPVIGLVCMNQTIVDVSKVRDVKVGDTATLIGRDGNDRITVEEIAHKLNTNYHEVMSRFPENIERIYYE